MARTDIEELLTHLGVFIDGHFVYKSGKHGSRYVNKDALFQNPYITQWAIGGALAGLAPDIDIDVVVSPVTGGIVLANWTAVSLSFPDRAVQAVFAERKEETIVSPEERGSVLTPRSSYNRKPGDVFLVRHPGFVIRRGGDKIIREKNVLVVDDVVNDGSSLRETIEAVRVCGGIVVAAICLYNRGAATAESLGVPVFRSVIAHPETRYAAEDCPHCCLDVPVNTDFGYGTDFQGMQERLKRAALAPN